MKNFKEICLTDVFWGVFVSCEVRYGRLILIGQCCRQFDHVAFTGHWQLLTEHVEIRMFCSALLIRFMPDYAGCEVSY